MKSYITKFAMIFIISTISLFSQRYVDSKDYTTVLTAVISTTPKAQIILSWEKKELAVGYYLFKKKCSDLTFGSAPIIQVDSLVLTYTDNDVVAGECYEYELWIPTIAKYSNGSEGLISGYAYTTVGLEMAEPNFGTCLILIDSSMVTPLKNEIEVFVNDLQNEGWNTVTRTASRAEKFDKDKVKATKMIILEEYNKNQNISTVILIGRVPVAYSGGFQAVNGQPFPPDGHPDHGGAWPADMYYGSINEGIWTDVSVNLGALSGQREENKNVPGDGKYDMTVLGNNNIQLAVGRIDLYNMKAFHKSEWTEPEIELMKRYFNKNHSYRTGNIPLTRKGLVDESESFTAKNIIEGFASSGWRNFYSWFGANNVEKKAFFNTLKTDFYMGTYATGPGSFTSAGGIGTTNDFVNNQVNTIFTMLFGSYFGDWDVTNSLLRAPLCSEPSALTSGWAARPHWYLHKMTMGYPIGTSVLSTQNNTSLYKPIAIYDGTQQRWTLYSVAPKNIHTALMGDPTLTLYPKSEVSEPKNLSVVELTNGDIELKWTAPEDDKNAKYAIYRKEGTGNFKLITNVLITDTEYIDKFKYDGKLEYQVKAVKLINTHTGSFYRTGRAISASVITTDLENSETSFSISAGPIPAFRNIKFAISVAESSFAKLEIFSVNGDLVNTLLNSQINSGKFSIHWDLADYSGKKLSQGIYLAKFSTKEGVKVLKLIIE